MSGQTGTDTSATPKATPLIVEQDQWITGFTGISVDRSQPEPPLQPTAALDGTEPISGPLPQGPSAGSRRPGATLLSDQQKQVTSVDNALQELTNTAAAIGSPIARGPTDTAIAALKLRRDALANAGATAAIQAEIKKVPALLADINLAKTAAQTAKDDWDKLVARKDVVETRLTSAENWIKQLPKGSAGAITNELTALRTRISNLATAASLADYGTALTALESDSTAFFAKARETSVPSYANKQLDLLRSVARRCGDIATPNPMQNRLNTLTEDQKNAMQSLTGSARTDELARIGSDAVAAVNVGWAAYQARVKITRQLYAFRVPLGALPSGPEKTTLTNDKLALETAVKDAFKRTDENIAAVGTALATVSNNAGALKTRLDRAQVAILDVEKTKTQIAASLAEARKTIDAITDDPTKKGFDQLYANLVKRRDDALAITSVANQKAELFAVNKEALAIVERANKTSFEAQLSQPDGKKKIADLVKTFGETTSDPVKQAICRAAMSACYKVDLDIPEGMSVTRLPKLFELFGQVPAKDLKNLKTLEYETDPDMGSSYYSRGKIVLNKIGSDGHTYQMDRSKPESRVNYFNATTLHEIGHNADDASSIMSNNMSGANFGGWKSETVDSVAAAHYETSFKSLVGTGKKPSKDHLIKMIHQVLQTGASTKPANATADLGTLFDDWNAITRSQGYRNLTLVRNDTSSPWEKNIDCSDGRSYHEGYKGVWYSYLATARATKISDYMWRAPGEWFADQYAYYRMHADKSPPASIATYVKD
jgi:hypothetical protein